MEERLQKLIAHAGIASRRAAEELIANGLVTINGKVASVGDKADPTKDEIRVEGRRLKLEKKRRYIALYKKRGVVSSTVSQGDRQTVVEIVNTDERLYPVGRLDIDSEGLVLLTNDGDLTHKITHPRYGLEKTYKVQVSGKPSWETLEKWRSGIVLEGERTAPAKIRVLEEDRGTTWLRVVMHEGKKRQIRRVAEALGHPALRLIRTHIGPIEIGRLKPGQYRELTRGEIETLKAAVAPKSLKRIPKPRKKGGE